MAGLLLDGVGQYDLQINVTYNRVIANCSGRSLDWRQLQRLCLPHLDTELVSVDYPLHLWKYYE